MGMANQIIEIFIFLGAPLTSIYIWSDLYVVPLNFYGFLYLGSTGHPFFHVTTGTASCFPNLGGLHIWFGYWGLTLYKLFLNLRWTPYGNTKCIICKQQVHQDAKYCHTCAYSKGKELTPLRTQPWVKLSVFTYSSLDISAFPQSLQYLWDVMLNFL